MALVCLAMRPLVSHLHDRLSGTICLGIRLVINSYVDDTQAVLSSRAEAVTLKGTMGMGEFSAASGLTVNCNKSKALALGTRQT